MGKYKTRITNSIVALGVVLFVAFGYSMTALGGIGSESVQVYGGLGRGNSTTSYQSASPQMVWVSDTSGFVFANSGAGNYSMSTTSDGGATWSGASQVDSVNTTDTVSGAVWYDRWTEGDTGNIIHVVTTDTSVDDTYYTQVNALTGVRATTVLGTTQAGTCTVGSSCYTSITKAKNGVLYMTAADGQDSWVVSCSGTCTTAGNWSERTGAYGGTPDLGDDIPILLPLANTDNIILIYYDNSAGTLDWNTYSATSSSWQGAQPRTAASGYETEVNYEGNAISATYSTTTGNIYVAVRDNVNDFTTQDHEIDIWEFATTTFTWTQKTNATTTTKGGILGHKLHLNNRNDLMTIAYGWRSTIGTPSTANLYVSTSINYATNWTASSTQMAEKNDSFTNVDIDPFSLNYFGVSYKYVEGATNASIIYYNRIMKFAYEVGGVVASSISRQSEIWFD